MKRQSDQPTHHPATHPLDDAMEEAYNSAAGFYPHLPGHTDDAEYREARPATNEKLHATPATGDRGHVSPQARTGNGASATEETAAIVTGGGNNGYPASVIATAAPTPCFGRAREADTDSDVPESVVESLDGLRPWQQQFALALMGLGGCLAEACSRVRVSKSHVEQCQLENPAFARACEEAVNYATSLREGALHRSGTIGDLEPVFRKGKRVGFKRTINVKAAERVLKLRRERSNRQEFTNQDAVPVKKIPDDQLPALLAEVSARIANGNRGRPVFDATTGEMIMDAPKPPA